MPNIKVIGQIVHAGQTDRRTLPNILSPCYAVDKNATSIGQSGNATINLSKRVLPTPIIVISIMLYARGSVYVHNFLQVKQI